MIVSILNGQGFKNVKRYEVHWFTWINWTAHLNIGRFDCWDHLSSQRPDKSNWFNLFQTFFFLFIYLVFFYYSLFCIRSIFTFSLVWRAIFTSISYFLLSACPYIAIYGLSIFLSFFPFIYLDFSSHKIFPYFCPFSFFIWILFFLFLSFLKPFSFLLYFPLW